VSGRNAEIKNFNTLMPFPN